MDSLKPSTLSKLSSDGVAKKHKICVNMGASRHGAAKSAKSSSGSVLKLSKIALVHKLLFKASKMPI